MRKQGMLRRAKMKGLHHIWILPLLFAATSCTYTFYPASCEYPVAGAMKKTAVLSDSLVETSGLAYLDSLFISFNDSGGDPALYFFNDSGSVLQKTMVRNAVNADWEDIAYGDGYFYVADVGNNFGTKDTLQIYKIPANMTGSPGFLDVAEVISFSYDEPVERTGRGLYSHDCEALFLYGDSVYLFAKDWVHLETRVYVLPAKAGHYRIRSRMAYPVNTLITGADVDRSRREVVLVGYNKLIPVIIRYGFKEDPAVIACGGTARRYPRLAGTQMEGICYDPSGRIFVSSEKRLYRQALYQAY
jgi:hypothetical protein